MLKHTQKILSLLLLLGAISLNISFSHHTTYKSLAECIDNFETVASWDPSNFDKDSSGKFVLISDEARDGDMLEGIAPQEGCNTIKKVDVGAGALSNPDIDEDGVLTVKEVYINGSVDQLNSYMNGFIDNIYSSLNVLLVLLDMLVLYAVVSAWLPVKIKN